MNITKKKKIEILQKALGSFVQENEVYSCNAVWTAAPLSIANEVEVWYQEILEWHSGESGDLTAAFCSNDRQEDRPKYLEHRMMWLAWLITMLEEGLES